MRRVIAVFVALLSVQASQSARAQDPKSSPPTSSVATTDPQLQRRVTLDLQVTDSANKPVSGLDPKEIHLFDHGDAQPITSFLEVTAHSAPPPTEAILLVDAVNITVEDVGLVRQGIEKFLRRDGGHLPMPVSIFYFTDTGIKLNKPSINGVQLADDFKKLPTTQPAITAGQGLSEAIDRMQRSLRALQLLSDYEAAKPGRKLLLWMSPGWSLLAGAEPAVPNGENARRYYATIVETTTALRRAHITLYSVPSLNVFQGIDKTQFLYKDYLKGITSAAKADSPYLGLQVLAVHAGGLALGKNGDLPAQIDLCLADADSYYEVTFAAAPGNKTGEYRPIEIHIDRPGVSVRTNSAYYAGPPQDTRSFTPVAKPQAIPATVSQPNP